ncbi:MAG: alanine dehydrogenase [Bifidobacteriaceae bacterium]|jgi:alanine dehydrogenase|nr:alanine dehydrogenase [Bifidobacteriaceae bacterium]
MIIGVPKETKTSEQRVALTPAGVRELTARGHRVVVESGAGAGSGFADAQYSGAGALIGTTAEAWAAELVVKVKEPIAPEYGYLRPDQILFTYLHLAAAPALVDALIQAGTTAIAYETVQLADGSLPLLAPMSEVAGRMAAMVGAYHLMRPLGGAGVLAGGVPGVRPAQVTVIGAGQAGANATAQAVGLGADVTVLDLSVPRLRQLDQLYAGRVRTVVSSALEIERSVLQADLVIGAVLVPGDRAPKLVSHELVTRMRPGAVLVDIAIDQGGCFEDSTPTTHDSPTYKVADTVFYCVANMPGAVPNTSTAALTNATMPYVLALADRGWQAAVADDPALAKGLATQGGRITHPLTAQAFPGHPSTLALAGAAA